MDAITVLLLAAATDVWLIGKGRRSTMSRPPLTSKHRLGSRSCLDPISPTCVKTTYERNPAKQRSKNFFSVSGKAIAGFVGLCLHRVADQRSNYHGWALRRRRFWSIGCLLAVGLASHSVFAEPSWPGGTYGYVVVDQDLRDVLQQFGVNTGLKLAVSDKVHGRVHGPVPSVPAKQFLDSLAQQFGLEWVYDGSIITVSSASEAKTEVMPLGDVPFDRLRDGLASAGFLDPRYQFKPFMGGHGALVSGPPRFISLVHEGLAAFPAEKPRVTEPAAAPPVVQARPAPPTRSVTVMKGSSTSVVEFKP
jgi:hypothetical protein